MHRCLSQAGPIYEDELYEAVVARLVKGSRLHCFVDTCRGIFALGLPSCVYTRADGWSNWEVRQLLHFIWTSPYIRLQPSTAQQVAPRHGGANSSCGVRTLTS